jgi:RecA-family ATPase
MCDTPPTLIILHVNLVQHFIRATRITTDIWSLVMYITHLGKSKSKSKSASLYDRPAANFSISLRFSLKQLLFVML